MLILASQSPSRSKLLQQLGVPFEIQSADIDETPMARERPTSYVTRVAREKAEKVSELFFDRPILAADTIVAVGTRVLRSIALDFWSTSSGIYSPISTLTIRSLSHTTVCHPCRCKNFRTP